MTEEAGSKTEPSDNMKDKPQKPDAPLAAVDGAGSSNARLEVARRFLEDKEVKDAPREQKVEFLKSKGLRSDEIERLLGEDAPAQNDDAKPESDVVESTEDQSESASNPPVITYPEFLTKLPRPSPLVGINGVLNSLYAAVGLSTLLYGTSKYAVEPMLEAQTDARVSFHETALQNLSSLIEKLEVTVSELPPTSTDKIRVLHEDGGECDDPTELFHRDVGTQTSPQPKSPVQRDEEDAVPSSTKQASQLAKLATRIAALKGSIVAQSEDLEDIETEVDIFKGDIAALTTPQSHMPGYAGAYSPYGFGGGRRGEPDDEIKKAKDNIRGVKGVLLSTRNFPVSAR